MDQTTNRRIIKRSAPNMRAPQEAKMSALNNRLQLSLLNRKKGHNLLEKGFTLVELMIVIVIVGILSAVALPNFLSQTDKAKATEAKTVSSAYLKQIYAAFQEGGSTVANSTNGTGSISCPGATNYFTFACDEDGTTEQIVATGTAASGSLENYTITSTVYLTTTAASSATANDGTTSGQIAIGNPTAP